MALQSGACHSFRINRYAKLPSPVGRGVQVKAMVNRSIFFDATGRRAARVSFIGWTAALISVLLGAAFVANLVMVPDVGRVKLPGEVTAVQLEKKAIAPGLLKFAANLAAAARQKREQVALAHWQKIERARHAPLALRALEPQPGRPLSIAFFPNWDALAPDSLKTALPSLDWVMPTWLNLQGPGLTLNTSFSPSIYQLIRRNKANVAIIPTVQNATLGKWDGDGLAKLLADRDRRTALVNGLVSFVGTHKLQGITVDFDNLPQSAYGSL